MKIVVLAGGISTERDVSLSSGKMIYRALKQKHQVILLDVYLGNENDSVSEIFDLDKTWDEHINPVSTEKPNIEFIKNLRKDKEKGLFGPQVIDICREADLVFMALHGENGEDGKIQAVFDLLGIRYTGTDSISSAIAMNKVLTKELFFYNNIPTPESITLKKGKQLQTEVTLPCVVKTSCGGSSIGVYLVNTQEELKEAIEKATAMGSEILLEQYIKGREFAVGVIDGKALPVIEIVPNVGFYDYKNKYQPGSTVEICPAVLETKYAMKMQKIAEEVFEVLRLKVYARMDFMMDDRGNCYCLEANTLPGMTPTSLLPQEAAASGKSFEQLCEWILELSLLKEQ